MINFLAEITKRFNNDIHLTPVNEYKKTFNVYCIDIRPHPVIPTYWEAWGGTYDNFTGTQIDLYFSRFLIKVNSIDELLITEHALYVRGDYIVFVNLPVHPWLYSDYAANASYTLPFLSAALNYDNPSMNEVRQVQAPVRLTKPQFNIKLSENISGIILNQSLSIKLINNDGYFDNDIIWNLFNTPLYLKKAINDNPVYDDFKTIRYSLIENTNTNFKDIVIEAADRLRSMDEPVCDLILQENYSIEIDETALNKNIPIVYGTKKINITKINETVEIIDNTDDVKIVERKYIIAEYVTELIRVLDRDSNDISFNYDENTGLVTILPAIDDEGKEYMPDASFALVTGYTNNKIGEIIIDLITRKADVQFNETNWDIPEVERYIDTSYRVNFSIENGNVKTAIQNVLKNEMAYLIEQPDSKFTIRKYGTTYSRHVIQSWILTKTPDKNWKNAQDNYFSSCIINYDKQDDIYKSYLYAENEKEAEKKYRRRRRKTFDTDLYDIKDVVNLAETLTERYTTMKQTIKISVGFDTSEFKLLDLIVCNANINDRNFSDGEYFIIKELDPAQDIMTLEELDMLDITGEYPETNDHTYDIDGLFAYSDESKYKYLIDGGIQ